MPKLSPDDTSPNTSEAIVADCYYAVRGKRRFDFEGIKFGPLIHTEILGEVLQRLAQSPFQDAVEVPQQIPADPVFSGTPQNDPQV